MSGRELGALLDVAAPEVSVAQAEMLARDLFGLHGAASALTGERDRNFLLRAPDGAGYVLKVVHPAEDPGVTDFQSRALLHAKAADPGLPIPRVHAPLAGGADALWQEAGHPARRVRVLDYMEGRPLHLLPSGPALRGHLGAALGRLDRALSGFAHPHASHPLLWDLQNALQVRDLLDEVPDPARRALPMACFARFEAHVLPVIPRLRAQVVHNDFNPHNVLAHATDDDLLAGIIDFGDMLRAPLVQDLATAAAYQVLAEGHPLQGPADMAAAYHAVYPLLDDEIAVLADLVATRMALTVAISSWRAVRHPDNAAYILRNQPAAWRGLERLQNLSRAEAQDYLAAALSS